jgi:hypothetical protein
MQTLNSDDPKEQYEVLKAMFEKLGYHVPWPTFEDFERKTQKTVDIPRHCMNKQLGSY